MQDSHEGAHCCVHVIPSMGDPHGRLTQHHTTTWGEGMLVPGLCLPGDGLPSSLSHVSEEHQIHTGGLSRSYCL